MIMTMAYMFFGLLIAFAIACVISANKQAYKLACLLGGLGFCSFLATFLAVCASM